MPDPCILCDTTGESLLYRAVDGVVLLDDPVRPGHVLVGASRHVDALHELEPDEAAAVLHLANRVAKIIVSATGCRKLYVAAIGDKDKHFHVHLLPKMDGEPNLGPHVFGSDGWISFLSLSSAPDATARVSDAVRRGL